MSLGAMIATGLYKLSEGAGLALVLHLLLRLAGFLRRHGKAWVVWVQVRWHERKIKAAVREARILMQAAEIVAREMGGVETGCRRCSR